MSQSPRSTAACRQTLLAKDGPNQISHCTCGTVSVTVRNVTFRLTPEDFQAFAALAAAASAGLECAAPPAEHAIH